MDVDNGVKKVRFDLEEITTHFVPAYSDHYPRHPRRITISKTGLHLVPSNVDPFTSMSADVMISRRERHRFCDKTKVQNHWKRILRGDQDIEMGVEDVSRAAIERCYHVCGRHFKGTPLRRHVKAIRTPSTKKKGANRQGAKAVKKLERVSSTGDLNPHEATMFRAFSARANYLAQDRPDIAFSTKELCREFAVPNHSSFMKLKRVVRYLIGLPRLVYRYEWQKRPTHLDIFTDSDFAGCKVSRRSTSGGVIMHGTHCLKHWASTQSTLSLSTAESELHGISKGIQMGLGFRSMCTDLNRTIPLRLHSDATAAIGIARRRGLGKLRHLDVQDLCIQEKIRNKEVDLCKVLGADNPADIFTKYVDHPILSRALTKMGLYSEQGRAKSSSSITTGAKQ